MLASLVVRLAAIRWAVKTFVGLGLLVPTVFVLKLIGLPILAVLGVIALPVMLVLFVLGLPIFLVLIVAGVLLAGLFLAMTAGLFAIKILVFVVLPVWLVWLALTFFRRPSSSPVAPAGSSGSA